MTGAATAPAHADPAPSPAAATLLAPYYTELDLTGDDQVTTEDLDVLAAAVGTARGDAGWEEVADLDLSSDGAITSADLALLSQRIVYDDGAFEIVEADVVAMQAAMNAGVITSVELTQQYLDRIDAYDDVVVAGGSRPLASVITVNRDSALAAAAAADTVRAERGMTSPLLGVPTGVKDNYNTVDMVTTAGCACWEANQTSSDAAMVEGLRSDGAVIVAKTSLDEFAYGFSSQFTAFEPDASPRFVASPYLTDQTAGGSSGGTGAAVAANLIGIGFGTDTGGSIRVPSSYNQLVGVRPTVGLASRSGIVPLALSQDTGGPMTRSTLDAAVALDAVVGVDPDDPVTAGQAGKVPTSYTSHLDPDSLRGSRLGYFPNLLSSNATTQRLWAEAVETMEELGAEVVELPTSPELTTVLEEGSGSGPEFNHDLDAYVAEHLAEAVPFRSLAQIVQGGQFVRSRSSIYTGRAAVTPEEYEAWAGPDGSHTAVLADGKELLTGILDDQRLDAVIYPSTNPYASFGRNMRLSPNTGLPAVTVPMGQAAPGEARTGAGVNLELLGRDFDEGPLLGLAYAFEQATEARTSPSLYGPLP